MKIKSLFVIAGILLSLNAQGEDASSKTQPKELVAFTSKLITPTLWALAPDVFACNLTNVTSTPHTVRVRIISQGKVLKDSGKISLAPQYTENVVIDGFAGGGLMFCEFSVDGLKGWYRGAAKMFHGPAGSDFIAIAAE